MGVSIPESLMKRAVMSVVEIGYEALDLDAESELGVRLDYAASTVLYGLCNWGGSASFSESYGDVKISRGAFAPSESQKRIWRQLANKLRIKWGYAIEPTAKVSGMFDATNHRSI